MVGGQHRLNERTKFHLTTVLWAVVIAILTTVWLVAKSIKVGVIVTGIQPLDFIIVVGRNPVIFTLFIVRGVWNKLIAPYNSERLEKRKLKLERLKNSIGGVHRDRYLEVEELRNRVETLEQKLESSTDLQWLYYETLKRLLGSEEKAVEEIDVQWQLEEALLQ
jgi:hypothetical protein